MTITLFSGLDPSVYEQARLLAGAIAVAEKTCRTWWQDHDSKYGLIVDFKDDPNPPPGSSGLQLRYQLSELLEGYRPGRIIRLRPHSFPNVKPPAEERIKSLDKQ